MIVIVMGVVGAGKTTIGQELARQLGWEFADADNFHPATNIEKIRHGISLTDEDRWPWLKKLRAAITNWSAQQGNVVLACSALKRSYRDELRASPEVRFAYLKANPEQIAEHLRSRHGHFADEQILASQFADLEEPQEESDVVTVEINQSVAEIVAEIRRGLSLA